MLFFSLLHSLSNNINTNNIVITKCSGAAEKSGGMRKKISISLNLQVEFIMAIFSAHFSQFFFFFLYHTLGRPQPAVRWLINGLAVDDQYEHNSGDVIENRLLWPQIQRSDLNSIFTCQASNTKLVEPKETSFVLDMHCKFFFVWLMKLNVCQSKELTFRLTSKTWV